MIDFTSFGKLIPDSVQLHYSLSKASLQLPYSLNSYRSLYPQELGRDCLPTRAVLRDQKTDAVVAQVHGLLQPQQQTQVLEDKMYYGT